MPAASNIVDLRRLLVERFGAAVRPRPTTAVARVASGLAALDELLAGGWPAGEVSELVGEGPGSGSAQVLHAFLRQIAAEGQFLALADGGDSFDVEAPAAASLARLLWVRCRSADETLKAADILLRDRNLSRVVIDLKTNPPTELRRISGSVWHRFHRLTEHHGTTALVITPQPLVAGAACRVRVASRIDLATVARGPAAVAAQLQFELLRTASRQEVRPLEAAG